MKRKNSTMRFVDFKNEVDDRLLLQYVALGYSNKYIASKTTLTEGQIVYRTGKLRTIGINRADYRNGGGILNNIIEKEMRKQIDSQLMDYLARNL